MNFSASWTRPRGLGLPGDLKDRVTEPYVTTREKGTGLGLAIVKKIMEDHGGDLLIEDRQDGGARISMVLPVQHAESGASDAPSSDPAKSE